MFILYNDQLLPETELRLPLKDRAFQYNDGFFETAMVVQGQLRFWADHRQRMQEAAIALQLQLPDFFTDHEFERRLLDLARQQGADKYGRLKLKVWRGGAGLYSPQTNKVNWLATVHPASPATPQQLKVGICQNVKTAHTAVSHFKGPNAPLYILASLERQEQRQDDMLLLDRQGNVAELTSSNIFWLKDNNLYTPHLQTGCVEGILRRNILRWSGQNNLQVQQVLHKPELLQQADVVFSANVTGIRGIASINGTPTRQYDGKDDFLQKLREALRL